MKEGKQNLVESKVTEEDEAAESGREEPAQPKPPKIPSLKGKIYQTALGQTGLPTSKSGLRTDAALTGITGLTTFDDKNLHPGDYGNGGYFGAYSRTCGATSAQNV